MLAELHIRNFALIERQRVSFGPGLAAVTGSPSMLAHASALVVTSWFGA